LNAPASDRLQDTVRTSRATLLSYLASRAGGDLVAAEDALSDAVLAAMRQWPEQGIPDKPEAWLLAIAKRRLIDGQRRQFTRDRYSASLRNRARDGRTRCRNGR